MTQEELRALLEYEPDTGAFRWKVDRRMGRTGKGHLISKAGAIAGGISKGTGYRQIVVLTKHYLEHRLAHFWMTGKWPEGQVDHINGNRQDNRWINLRDVPENINKQNLRRARSDSKTGIQGVNFNPRKNKFVARIRTGGHQQTIGYFDCAQAAHSAYLYAKRALHEGCTI